MAKPIAPINMDKMAIKLLEDDIVAAVNQAMRVRKITITIDYTHKDRLPRAFLSMPGVEKTGWMISSPRTRVCNAVIPAHPDLLAFLMDLESRLRKLDARITMRAKKPPNQKAIAKLQVEVNGVQRVVLTLTDVVDGGIKHKTHFLTTDGRNL